MCCQLAAVMTSQDFVGRCCRVSRRISPVAVGLRVLQRYLVMGKKGFEKQAADDKANLESKIPAKRARLGYDKPRGGAK